MNCAELHQDIANLKEIGEPLLAMFNDAVGNGKISKNYQKQVLEVSNQKDIVIQKYLNSIIEYNPDEFDGILIDATDTIMNGKRITLRASSMIPAQSEKRVLVGGKLGLLYSIDETSSEYSDNRELNFVRKIITLPNSNTPIILGEQGIFTYTKHDNKWEIEQCGQQLARGMASDIISISENDVIVRNNVTELYIYHQENEKWELKDLNKEYNQAPLIKANTIVAAPEQNAIIAAGNNTSICIFHKENDQWVPELIPFSEKKLRNITMGTPMPDGSGILLGGPNGALYHCHQENGQWTTGKQIDGFKSVDKMLIDTVHKIIPLPGGNDILISGSYGGLHNYHKVNSEWQLSKDSIDGFIGSTKINSPVNASVVLPNKDVLIGGDNGALCILRKENDKWVIRKNILKDNEIDGNITNICKIPDTNTICIGTNMGSLYTYNIPTADEAISVIVQKNKRV